MRIISRRTLREYWEKHPDAEQSLKAWFQVAAKAQWKNFQDVKAMLGTASIIGNDRVVFNIKGNHYRLIVLIHFKSEKMFIRFVGTHKEYDRIDAKTI